jgi:hypothetical protein
MQSIGPAAENYRIKRLPFNGSKNIKAFDALVYLAWRSVRNPSLLYRRTSGRIWVPVNFEQPPGVNGPVGRGASGAVYGVNGGYAGQLGNCFEQ